MRQIARAGIAARLRIYGAYCGQVVGAAKNVTALAASARLTARIALG